MDIKLVLGFYHIVSWNELTSFFHSSRSEELLSDPVYSKSSFRNSYVIFDNEF